MLGVPRIAGGAFVAFSSKETGLEGQCLSRPVKAPKAVISGAYRRGRLVGVETSGSYRRWRPPDNVFPSLPRLQQTRV